MGLLGVGIERLVNTSSHLSAPYEVIGFWNQSIYVLKPNQLGFELEQMLSVHVYVLIMSRMAGNGRILL